EQVVADRKPLLAGGTPGAENALAPESASVLRIPPGHGELQFQYTALNLTAPDKSRFEYKLDRIDKDWIDAGTRRTAYYNNLPPGAYNFHVKACNQDGVWNKTGASLSLVLLPYYWQTWWFRSLGVLIIIGSISGLALYATRRRMQRKLARLEQQHAIEKERGRIAKDMHDQIGAGLTQIGLLSEFARREADKNGDTRVHAEKIHEVAHELAQTLDEIVWMVNPRNDTLNKLGLYLAAYVEEFFQATNIRCRLDIPPGLPACPLSAELRHNLFLTVKEALNNIAKHSRASEAHVRLAPKHSQLEIVIEDNGTGFSVDPAKFSRNGLSNMKERIEEIGGTFEIFTRPDNGTRICLRTPLKGALSTNEDHESA
ncbi:MAG: ATP-binding protein, partial [Limisphaerales bacterium]